MVDMYNQAMRIDEQIKTILAQIVSDLGAPDITIELEESSDPKFGDYTSNLAMKLAKPLGRAPSELAAEICERLAATELAQVLASAAPAGPGFINLTLRPAVIWQAEADVLAKGDAAGYNESRADKTVLVEHSSPNLFKPFHIGHMMNNTIGESLVRLSESAGAKTVALSYPSDISLGIGKAVWALQKTGVEPLLNETLPQVEKLKLLGQAYVDGTKAYDEDETAKAEIRAITQSIYAGEDGEAWQIYQAGRELSLAYFKDITARLGSQFQDFIFESEAGLVGKEIVEEYLVKGIFEKSDGAVIYNGEAEGLHTRVFVNSEGNPTYEAKDIGLMKIKNERYHPDTSITVTDHEQAPYFKVVANAAGKINPAWAGSFRHVTHGRMQFKGQKMSSRLGGVPLAEEMIQVVRDEVLERAADRDLPDETIDAIAIGAIKFVILKAEAGKNINFDPDTSLSFEGDSGPYLQYTYARIQSLLEKGSEAGITPAIDEAATEVSLADRKLLHFAEIVERAQREYAPHHIVGYLLELARECNSWYASAPILTGPQPAHDLARAQAIGQVIKNGLRLLAIDAPIKM